MSNWARDNHCWKMMKRWTDPQTDFQFTTITGYKDRQLEELLAFPRKASSSGKLFEITKRSLSQHLNLGCRHQESARNCATLVGCKRRFANREAKHFVLLDEEKTRRSFKFAKFSSMCGVNLCVHCSRCEILSFYWLTGIRLRFHSMTSIERSRKTSINGHST